MEGSKSVNNDPLQVILLATDGSEFSLGTERVALDMARQQHSHLYVLRLLLSEPGTAEHIAEEAEASLQMEQLQETCNERGIACTPLIRNSEDPSWGILQVAKEIQVDILVVGRRGRRGLARFMVGDATGKVIEQADCTVMVVPRLVSMWNNSILMVMVPSQPGDMAAHTAFQLAKSSNLPLTILMVMDEDKTQEEQQKGHQTVVRLLTQAKEMAIEAQGLIEVGQFNEVVLATARQRSADLIVGECCNLIDHEQTAIIEPMLQVIGKTFCPVMIVK